ncbi:MAG: YfdX family protein [Rhodospirillales bacterium]|nr:YfdX family protein [Rhodospirillales bacterium]
MNVKRVVPSVLTTALVAGMTIAGSPVSAADQSAKMTEVLTIQDTGWSSERSETLALNLGQLLVSRIARAKQLVDRGDLSKAQLAILDAESTADVIVNISPVIRVTDKITDMNNKVLVDDTESFADTLIPINGYVDEMEIFAPKLATATRKKVSAAQEKAAAKDAKGAAKIMQEVADDLASTTYYLPVRHAYDQLVTARLALAGKTSDVATAKKAIASALDVVVVKVDAIESAMKS